MKKIVVIFIFLGFFCSCDNNFPDYINKEEGVYIKLLSFGEGSKKYQSTYYTKASVKVTSANKLIYQNFQENILSPENINFDFLLSYLTEGDSASFMISSGKIKHYLQGLKLADISTDYVKVVIKVHQYLSLNEYKEINKNFDKEMKEQLLLKKYLKENNIHSKNFFKGIYIQQLEKGAGKKIKKGSSITINYKGYFINQLEFDNTYKDIALTFTYGAPDQVIKGLNIAIKGMKKGEKSKIIIPSQLAFGEDGSTTQIVPPYTTVIYELEIVNVK